MKRIFYSPNIIEAQKVEIFVKEKGYHAQLNEVASFWMRSFEVFADENISDKDLEDIFNSLNKSNHLKVVDEETNLENNFYKKSEHKMETNRFNSIKKIARLFLIFLLILYLLHFFKI